MEGEIDLSVPKCRYYLLKCGAVVGVGGRNSKVALLFPLRALVAYVLPLKRETSTVLLHTPNNAMTSETGV